MEAAPWDPNYAPPEDFAAYQALRASSDAEFLPDDAPMPVETVEGELRHVPAFRKKHHWVVRDGAGRIVGTSDIEWEETGFNVRLAEVEVMVLPEARGQGLARRLLRPLAGLAAGAGRTSLLAELGDRGPGPGFAASAGFRRGATERRSRLDIADVHAARLREWTKGVEGYELVSWDGPTPERLLEPFAALKAAESDAPFGDIPLEPERHQTAHIAQKDLARAAAGFDVWTVAARAHSGGLVAYTQLHWTVHRPELAWQAWTAVAPAHRGRGLARWVKAANALRLLEERPSVTHVDTFNEVTNAPMLAVNIDMGFRPLLTYGSWVAEADVVARFAAGASAPASGA